MQIAFAGDEYADYNSAGWGLNQGSDVRSFEKSITFLPQLAVTPFMHVALSILDADGGPNLRVNAYATNVTYQGFTLRIETWGDTILNAVRASWLALVP